MQYPVVIAVLFTRQGSTPERTRKNSPGPDLSEGASGGPPKSGFPKPCRPLCRPLGGWLTNQVPRLLLLPYLALACTGMNPSINQAGKQASQPGQRTNWHPSQRAGQAPRQSMAQQSWSKTEAQRNGYDKEGRTDMQTEARTQARNSLAS